MKVIRNVTVINGDGHSVLENGYIVIIGDVINEVSGGCVDESWLSDDRIEVIDGQGNYAIPGIINHHTHCLSSSPFMATGGYPAAEEKWKSDLLTHLKSGTTTIMTVDGFALAEEVAEAQRLTKMNVKFTAGQVPLLFEAARLFDGAALTQSHIEKTVLEQLNKGAVAVGEVGGGVSLGGAGQDYKYIPEALYGATGLWFDVPQCRDLKYAVLGRFIEEQAFDPERVAECLVRMGIDDRLSPADVRKLITGSVMSGFKIAVDAIQQSTEVAVQYGVPVIVHNAASSAKAVVRAAKYANGRTTFIAAHSNHSTFLTEESVAYAKICRDHGALIDVATLDAFGVQKIIPNPNTIYALIEEGLADLLSTDYGGGNFDSILQIVKGAAERRIQSLARLIQMCTSNVADAFPLLAPNRGRLEKGKTADVAIVNKNDLSDVLDVLVSGKWAVRGREIVSS